MSQYLKNMSELLFKKRDRPQQTGKDKNTTKQDRERSDVTLSIFDSRVRANLCDIGYESMTEEHVRNPFYKWD